MFNSAIGANNSARPAHSRYSIPVTLGRLGHWLVPGTAETDEAFRQESLSQSHRAMRVLGGVEAALGVAGCAGWVPLPFAVAFVLLGAATLGGAMLSALYPHGRTLAVVSCSLAAAIALRSTSAEFAPAAVAAVLITSTLAPLLAWQGAAIGAATIVAGLNTPYSVFAAAAALAETVITAALYEQRRSNHQAFVNLLQASQDFRSLQARVLLAESSATMMRLSAALAHELSSPIGALSSAVSTLSLISRRRDGATQPSEQNRLAALQSDLVGSLEQPLERLQSMVKRIQRLNNLDEATLQSADVNDLIHEAVGIVQPQAADRVRFEMHLQPVPAVTCRPQQLIAVLCNVLTNSLQALESEGDIAVYTSADPARIEVKIHDNGRGIPAAQLDRIFDPAFQVTAGRVSTGNWTLFTSRQFIKEHGGEMRIQSRPGSGTTVIVTLPCSS